MKYSSHPSIKLVWICGKFTIHFLWTSNTLHFKWNYRQTVVQNFSTMCKYWIFHKIFWNSIHELTYKCWIIVMTIKLGIMDYICEKEIFSIVFARLGKISCANGLRNINNHFLGLWKYFLFSFKGIHKHWWIGVYQTIVEPSSKIKYSMENIDVDEVSVANTRCFFSEFIITIDQTDGTYNFWLLRMLIVVLALCLRVYTIVLWQWSRIVTKLWIHIQHILNIRSAKRNCFQKHARTHNICMLIAYCLHNTHYT